MTGNVFEIKSAPAGFKRVSCAESIHNLTKRYQALDGLTYYNGDFVRLTPDGGADLMRFSDKQEPDGVVAHWDRDSGEVLVWAWADCQNGAL